MGGKVGAEVGGERVGGKGLLTGITKGTLIPITQLIYQDGIDGGIDTSIAMH